MVTLVYLFYHQWKRLTGDSASREFAPNKGLGYIMFPWARNLTLIV